MRGGERGGAEGPPDGVPTDLTGQKAWPNRNPRDPAPPTHATRGQAAQLTGGSLETRGPRVCGGKRRAGGGCARGPCAVVVVVVGALTAGRPRQRAGRHKSFRPLRRVGSSILLCRRPDKRKEEAGRGGEGVERGRKGGGGGGEPAAREEAERGSPANLGTEGFRWWGEEEERQESWRSPIDLLFGELMQS
ncbi:hypothetical protein U9M48_020343 [Paspalum notatum var. saurae]|uniref:Uncharacterized protein n=1 Tax=Paspalum notatum var. saurae TaxID=547442 RepID=A0AAQ3THV6_PASNO